MKMNAQINYLIIILFGFFAQHAFCSYNEVRFTMSRSYLIDTEGFAKFKVKSNVYYKYSSTFFEIILRDPEYDSYEITRNRNNQFSFNTTQNYSSNYSYTKNIQFNNYIVIFPLDIDEKVFNFSLTYDNKTYSSTENINNEIYSIVNDSFISNPINNISNDSSRMKMKVSILNDNLMINVSNLPIFFNSSVSNLEINNTENNSIQNDQHLNDTTQKKRKRRRNKIIINKKIEDPRKKFFEATIGFTIFKKLKIKNDKYGAKIAYYPLNYKTCDFCRSSVNLSHLHNFAFKFELEGHQNDQLFKYGKQQRKCIIEEEIDLLGNPLKFNITENATNKYTFYGFLLKLRLVKFPIYSVIDDDNFELLQNETNSSQLMKISVMPKSHRIMILLDDNYEFWQKELENSLSNQFPNSAYLIGHLQSKPDEFNFDKNINLNKDNETFVENISEIIKIYKPDIIINFINETKYSSQKDNIFDIEKVYKTAFLENSTMNLNDVLYIKSNGILSFDPLITDKIHQFDFSNSTIETNCGIQLNKTKNDTKSNKINQFSFLLPNKCKNCTFSFNNRTFHSWNASIFSSKILFNTLIHQKEKKGILSKKIRNEIKLSPSNKKEFYVINNKICDGLNSDAQQIDEFEILGPLFDSKEKENRNIKINLINDCNKCPNFSKICALQYKEEYQM